MREKEKYIFVCVLAAVRVSPQERCPLSSFVRTHILVHVCVNGCVPISGRVFPEWSGRERPETIGQSDNRCGVRDSMSTLQYGHFPMSRVYTGELE